MRFVPDAVSRKVARQILVGQKHSPTILFSTGVVGFVATTVLVARAAMKTEEVLHEIEKQKVLVDGLEITEEFTDKDKAKANAFVIARGAFEVSKLYAPAVAVGTVSIACLTGSHHIMTRRQVALTAAYASLERGYEQYRRRVINEYGKEKDLEFRHVVSDREIVEETKNGPKIRTVMALHEGLSPYAACFDEYSKNWSPTPSYNQVFIQAQQNYANDLLRARGHVFLNEVYDMLGLERTPQGQIVGWVAEGKGDGYIDFGIFRSDPHMGQVFVNGEEKSIWLDFNVDGPVWELI